MFLSPRCRAWHPRAEEISKTYTFSKSYAMFDRMAHRLRAVAQEPFMTAMREDGCCTSTKRRSEHGAVGLP